MHPHGSSRSETKGSHQSMREHTRAPDSLHKQSTVLCDRRTCPWTVSLKFERDTRHCERIVEALFVSNTSKSSDNTSNEGKDQSCTVVGEICSWESMQLDAVKQEQGGGKLSEEETVVCWSTGRIIVQVVDRHKWQHARLCSTFCANPTKQHLVEVDTQRKTRGWGAQTLVSHMYCKKRHQEFQFSKCQWLETQQHIQECVDGHTSDSGN